MREIRFRAWDKIKKIMYTPGDMKSQLRGIMDIVMQIHDGCLWDKKDFDSFYYFNNLILMQYTGLKDKNGKEIYEGDVVLEDLFRIPVVIEWVHGGFYQMKDGHGIPILNEHIKVIGNIYENPELLKEPTQ